MQKMKFLGVAVSTVALVAGILVTGTSAGAASGATVNVMLISQLQAPSFAFPEIEPITRAAIDQFDKAGGAHGTKVKLIVCNDKNDPNVAAGCARQAVSQHVAAVLGYFTFQGPGILPVLQQAGIPYVGNSILSVADPGNPVAFPLDGGIVSVGLGVGQALAKSGCHSVGAIDGNDIATTLYNGYVKKGVVSGGSKWAGEVKVSVGTPDYGPAVASIISQGADCVFTGFPPADSANLLKAVQQSGKSLRVGAGSANVPESVISQLPADATKGLVIVGTSPSPTDRTFAGVTDYLQKMKSAGIPNATVNASFALSSYAKTIVALKAMKTIQGTIDNRSMMTAMSSITDPGTPLVGSFSTTKESSIPGFNRLFNFKVLQYVVKNRKLVLKSTGYLDTAPIAGG